MFPNLGMSELILILVIALVVFGPRKLPEIGRSLGRTLNEFRRASLNSFGEIDSVKEEIKDELNDIKVDVKKAVSVKPEEAKQEDAKKNQEG